MNTENKNTTKIFCQQCDKELVENERPCSNCGSIKRTYKFHTETGKYFTFGATASGRLQRGQESLRFLKWFCGILIAVMLGLIKISNINYPLNLILVIFLSATIAYLCFRNLRFQNLIMLIKQELENPIKL